MFKNIKNFPPKDIVGYRDIAWSEPKRYKPGHEEAVKNLRTYEDGDVLVEYNALGFRGPDITQYPDKKKIVCIGCSMTEGEGVKYEHTWPAQFQERIKEKLDIDIPVFNLGRRSLGTASFFRVLLSLVEGRKIKPDVVIVLFPEFERHELVYGEWDIFFRTFTDFEDPNDIRKRLSHKWFEAVDSSTAFYLWLQQYFLIKYFLKSHGIMTVLTSWSSECQSFLRDFDDEYNDSGYIEWDAKDVSNEFYGIDIAIDHLHPGPKGYKLFVDNLENTLFTNEHFLRAITHDNLGNFSQQP